MVQEYIRAKNNLIQYFDCDDDYFIKTMTNYNWRVRDEDGVSILTYWDGRGAHTDALIVRKDSTPLIYSNGDYSMVIAIDCVKMAFIMRNSNREH